MSILIKGMNMPKGCDETCPLYLAGQCCEGCDCPIIEIPTPHGRLIDLGALPETRVEWEDIVNAPTILEAER